MRIIGFNLSKISVKREEKIKNQLKITQNIDIKEVVKESIPISDEEVIKIKFSFTIDYSENFAKIEFEGNLILLPEKEEMKTILREWKNKKIPEEIRVPLFNFIMSKCNIKALNLEDEMSLPLHIPMPKLNPNQDQSQPPKNNP